MTRVGIAQLKSHLSEYVRRVEVGETVEVLDRDRPVARLVPLPANGPGLVVRPATADWSAVTATMRADKMDLGATDSLAWLLADREAQGE